MSAAAALKPSMAASAAPCHARSPPARRSRSSTCASRASRTLRGEGGARAATRAAPTEPSASARARASAAASACASRSRALRLPSSCRGGGRSWCVRACVCVRRERGREAAASGAGPHLPAAIVCQLRLGLALLLALHARQRLQRRLARRCSLRVRGVLLGRGGASSARVGQAARQPRRRLAPLRRHNGGAGARLAQHGVAVRGVVARAGAQRGRERGGQRVRGGGGGGGPGGRQRQPLPGRRRKRGGVRSARVCRGVRSSGSARSHGGARSLARRQAARARLCAGYCSQRSLRSVQRGGVGSERAVILQGSALSQGAEAQRLVRSRHDEKAARGGGVRPASSGESRRSYFLARTLRP